MDLEAIEKVRVLFLALIYLTILLVEKGARAVRISEGPAQTRPEANILKVQKDNSNPIDT